MKLAKNYFENLSATKYREYLKLLPVSQKENTGIFVTLALTFASLSFFGIFANNPVLTTIIDLKKQLADSKLVDNNLSTKIANLSLLQQKYNNFPQSDLQIAYGAIPEKAAVPSLMGQIQKVAEDAKLSINALRISEVQLLSSNQLSSQGSSFSFFLEAKGSYEDMMRFSSSLTQFDRILTIDSLSISKDVNRGGLILALQGRSYFKK